jgi:hypothetical protein
MMPDRDRELEQYLWLRDNAEEAAASLRPSDIRTAATLRSGAQKNIDLIEGRFFSSDRGGDTRRR